MEKQVRAYLKKNKQYVLPTALFFAGVVLLFRIIIPQMGGVGDLRDEIESQIEANENLRESGNVLNSINEAQLDEDLNLVLRALPANKSIGSIYEALTMTAVGSNVTIGSLNLQVGSVYEAEGNEVSRKKIKGVPFLNMIVRVNGNSSSDATKFAAMLYEAVPLVEINSISATDSNGKYDVDFYFKPINTKSFNAQSVIQPLNATQQDLLITLRSWVQ